MNPEDLQKIIEYLKSLAQPAVERGWDIAYRQILLLRVWDLVFIVLSIIMILMLPKLIRFGMQKYNLFKQKDYYKRDEFEGAGWWMLVGCGYSGFIVSAIVILSNLYNVLGFVINPDWQVISLVLSMVK